MNVENKHIVIAGAARSGVAVAKLLNSNGAIPFVTDFGSIHQKFADQLHAESIDFEQNQHSEKAMNGDFLVLSPGVPTSSKIAQNYLNAGKKVFSEIEVASWFNRSPIVAVTGSNGKTTVANWLAHTWKVANKKHLLAGNIGTAFSDRIDETAKDVTALLEVSSFQLDHIDRFKPDVSIILNITADHLDRYQNDFNLYAQSKLRITENQDDSNWFIYNGDDPILSDHAEELSKKERAPRLLAFSSDREISNGAFVRDGELILKINNKEEQLMQIGEIGLSGKHNLQNGMATALAARASEIKNRFIRESLRTFEGVEHRLETVRTLKGVRYVNDSKATNVNAVWFALQTYNVPVVLILGGRDKGNDWSVLEHQIREKVHTIVAIGEARPVIKEKLGEVAPNYRETETLKQAVKLARDKAKRGEVVLLSPACSSFDMFDNFEHRGNEFKQAVLDL
ncbi:MAG: UDP-N-acetylmuramoyl-L-alanine--D-glutamate ligase [Balneolaceae bacterium]|nr:UDP-N-acetylmuramoyl-L-alanine--D-glutamate ligase [Balneolaceae bacterium]